MTKIDTAETKFLRLFRRRLVNEANRLNEIVKYAEAWRMIPLMVENLLRNAESNLIDAYLALPDE